MATTTTKAIQSKLDAVLRLSRWREHVPFTLPLTIFGGLLAVEPQGISLDWRIIALVFANIISMSFAFMINDIEDAPDDALEPAKRVHNVISSGLLSRREGIFLSVATFVVALALYTAAGTMTLVIGVATLALSYVYSAHPFRFKARPLTDVLSHALMLSGLLIAVGYFAYDSEPGAVWLVIGAAVLFSAYGQFYNQVADYDVDKEAGLRNTAVLLGKRATIILGHLSIFGAIACMLAASLQGIFPSWLGTLLIIGTVSCLLFPWEMDMRGNLARDGGNVQRPGLLVANILAFTWLAANLGLLNIT